MPLIAVHQICEVLDGVLKKRTKSCVRMLNKEIPSSQDYHHYASQNADDKGIPVLWVFWRHRGNGSWGFWRCGDNRLVAVFFRMDLHQMSSSL